MINEVGSMQELQTALSRAWLDMRDRLDEPPAWPPRVVSVTMDDDDTHAFVVLELGDFRSTFRMPRAAVLAAH